MLEKLKRVRPATALVLLAAIVGLIVMVANHWTPEQIAAVAGGLLAVMSQLDRLIGHDTPADPPPPPGAVVLPFALGLGLALTACAAKEVAAEAAYANEQYKRCVDPEPILSAKATKEERAAAWARVDACRAQVRERWGITETVTDKDGGQ